MGATVGAFLEPEGEAHLGRLTVLLVTAFLDSVGLLMVVPLLPFYATRLGGGGAVVGLLTGAVPLVQLVSAPLWGRLSDRVGRRPVLLIGMAASAVAYALLAGADSLGWLLVSRLVQGAGGGTTGVLQAYVADVTRPEERARALGRVSAATSLGVMLGPALGSLGGSLGPKAPALLAAVLCALNTLMAWWRVPEPPRAPRAPHTPLPPGERQGEGLRASGFPPAKSPLSPWERTGVRGVRATGPAPRLVLTYALAMGAFQGATAVLSLLLAGRFGLTERTVGTAFLFTGAIAVIARAVLLGPAVSRLGEARLWRVGVLLLAAGLTALPLASTWATLALALTLLPLGTAFTFPCVTALLSRHAAAGERGQVLGMQQSWGGVARALAPLGAGWAFEHLSQSAPCWTGAALALATLVLGPPSRSADPSRQETTQRA